MKTGKTIQEIAIEIARQAEAKKDFLAPTTKLKAVAVATPLKPEEPGYNQFAPSNKVTVALDGLNGEPMGITEHAHDQIASRLGIHRKYYDRMLAEAPELAAHNINHWLQATPKKQLVRTLDGKVRGFLSNGYRPRDYVHMAEAIFPVIQEMKLMFLSAEITERRLYIKAVDLNITKDIPYGGKMGEGHTFFDTLSPAIVISNSEVGAGAVAVEAGLWTRLCTNLAIAAQRSMRKYHIGAKQDFGEDVSELFSDDTQRKTDVAFWAQARDVVKAAFDRAKFDALISSVQKTTENKITGDPIKAMEITSVKLGLTEVEKTSVLRHLIQGGELSQYGLFNAVTRTAEDASSYDRATELERIGGEVIELKASEWKTIAEAA